MELRVSDKQLRGFLDLIEYYRANIPNIQNIVEVGVYAGEASVLLAKAFPNAKIWCVDPWNDMDLDVYAETEMGVNRDYIPTDAEERFDENTKDFPNIVKLKETSAAASRGFGTQSLDIVYIDAIHTYEYVKEDMKLWSEKLARPGIISGHDYVNKWHGVKQAVWEFCADSHPDKVFKDSSWAYLANRGVIND